MLCIAVYIMDNFQDALRSFKRGPQVILPKDMASIVFYTGLKPGDKVVDAGAGSGWLAAYMAYIVGPNGKVVTYERREEFADIAKKNFEKLELKNIKLRNKDILLGISEKNLDLVTLDFKDSWQAIPVAQKALKQNGFLVAYLPQATQVVKFVEELKNSEFKLSRVLEVLEREWKIAGDIARPEHNMLGHTAFLVFARKKLSN